MLTIHRPFGPVRAVCAIFGRNKIARFSNVIIMIAHFPADFKDFLQDVQSVSMGKQVSIRVEQFRR